jgi:ribonuclease VapC
MVIDTSALIAILRDEPDRVSLAAAIHRDPTRLVSAVTKLEAGIVALGLRGASGASDLDRLLTQIGAQIVPFDDDQANLARNAFERFGKGRHPAGLNFGDCAAYALASAEAEPLLFKGADFGKTDIDAVRIGGE